MTAPPRDLARSTHIKQFTQPNKSTIARRSSANLRMVALSAISFFIGLQFKNMMPPDDFGQQQIAIKPEGRHTNNNLRSRIDSKSPHLQDQTNVPIPMHIDGSPMSTEDRLRYLELKVNAFMNFGTDPFFNAKKTLHSCKKSSKLMEYGCESDNCPGL